MFRVETSAELRARIGEARAGGARIGLVPTMGYLHEGHLALVDRARELADFVVMSIFVNPLQFGPSEDLANYPRDLERDADLAQGRGVALLFHPQSEEVYPDGPPRVTLTAPQLTDRLCGRFRPGHFEGVLTVVAKLFNLVDADVAVFGQKDFQQSVVIRSMARDLDFTTSVEVAPIVRETDGLALSSRNVYLNDEQRRSAPALHASLVAASERFAAGERDARVLLDIVRQRIAREPGINLQYANLVDSHSLDDRREARSGDVIALAAFIGRTRLIDNQILP